jgi:hypothetical protein
MLYKLNNASWEWSGLFKPKTQINVQRAYAYSLGATGLTMLPGVALRTFGFRGLGGVHSVIYYSTWTAVLSWVGVLVLYGVAMYYPKEEGRNLLPWWKRPKAQLFVGSSLALGVMIAPLFLMPGSLLALAGGFTLSIVLPMGLIASISKNRLFLNIAGLTAMLTSAAVFQSEVLPEYFGVGSSNAMVLADSGIDVKGDIVSTLGWVGFVVAGISSIMLLGTANSVVSRSAGGSIFGSDKHVEVIEERQEQELGADGVVLTRTTRTTTRQSNEGDSIALHNPIATLVMEGVKPDDAMGMGLYVNLHTAYIFLKISWEFIKLAYFSKQKKQAEKDFRAYRTRNM